jgi:maltodextrin utilization protein YvdJ
VSTFYFFLLHFKVEDGGNALKMTTADDNQNNCNMDEETNNNAQENPKEEVKESEVVVKAPPVKETNNNKSNDIIFQENKNSDREHHSNETTNSSESSIDEGDQQSSYNANKMMNKKTYEQYRKRKLRNIYKWIGTYCFVVLLLVGGVILLYMDTNTFLEWMGILAVTISLTMMCFIQCYICLCRGTLSMAEGGWGTSGGSRKVGVYGA